jgi:glycerol-3-phosphate dehydrogenase
MIEYAERKFNEAYQLAANTALINKLVFTYGNNVELIIDKAFELYNQRTDKQYIWLEAEIWYGVEHEMIINLSDFLMRRSDRFYFESDKTLENLEKITNFLAQYLNWNEDEQERQVNDYKIIVNKNKVCLNSLNNK